MIRSVDETGASAAQRYQLKITLKWTKPPIWRRVIVRGNTKLNLLHDVIQSVMGWMNCHLHQFKAGGRFYGVPDPDYQDMGTEMLNERRYTVSDLAEIAKTFTYDYDFGDSWEHQVKIEKVLPPDPDFKHPICVAGDKACPPEDCGGIPGYYRLLEALANPRRPEHEELKSWIGGQWNADHFNLDQANAALSRIKT